MTIMDTNLSQPLSTSTTLTSMRNVGVRAHHYSILNLMIDAIMFFFGNNDAKLNRVSRGIYEALKNQNFGLDLDEENSTSLKNSQGPHRYKLIIDGKSDDIMLCIGTNNQIYFCHNDKFINLNTGQLINVSANINGRSDISPDFIGKYFSALLKNAILIANGNPPDYSPLPQSELDDAGLLTSTMVPLPDSASDKTLAHFDQSEMLLTGCRKTNTPSDIKGNVIHCDEYVGLAYDLARISQSETYITFNNQNILTPQICADTSEYIAKHGNNINTVTEAINLFRDIGDKIKITHGQTIFGDLSSEQGVYLIAMANSQGMTSQGSNLSLERFFDQNSHFFREGPFKSLHPKLTGATQKHIAVEANAEQASFKVLEHMMSGSNDKATEIHHRRGPGDTPEYKAKEITRWARCDIGSGPDFGNITPESVSYGYSLKLEDNSP